MGLELMMGLTAARGALDVLGQRSEAKAQAAAYENQARAEAHNAELARRRQEQIAERYAGEQRNVDAKMKLARGQTLAAAGNAGIEATSGTVQDVLAGNREAYRQESMELLAEQRNDNYTERLKEYDAREREQASRTAAGNVKRAAKGKMWGTILSTADSMWGIKKKYGKAKSP